MLSRGSDAVRGVDIWSADLGCLEGVPIRRSILVSRVLTRPGSFGGKAAKRTMGQKLAPYHAFRDPGVRWETSDAFNAPARVRASGGGRRPCALRPPVRVSLFRIRR